LDDRVEGRLGSSVAHRDSTFLGPSKKGIRVQVKITSRHGTVKTSALDHINSKAEKLLTYFERVTQIEVTVDFEHDNAIVEILVDAEHKHNFVASAEGDEVAGTFDMALAKMEQQIRRYKDKLTDHRRDVPMNGGAVIAE
jgi:putative sigma-54 modulation protein